MFGIKTNKGWLKPTEGPTKTFFTFDQKPHYPFRTKEGAKQIADDWLTRLNVTYEVREQGVER